MKQKICRITALFVLFCTLFSSCARPGEIIEPKNKYTTQSFDYFDTVTVITGYERTEEEFNKVADEILSQLSEYHRLYSIYHRFEGLENLCTVNELVDSAHRTVKVDRRIIDLLLYARKMHDTTGGRLNVAMGSVLSLWHDYRTVGMDSPDKATLPPSDRLETAAEHTDIAGMVIDEVNSTVTLTDPQMKLDVGGIAKGYAVEQIARYLEEKGITGYVLNVGGNVRTVGRKPDKAKWTVGIEKANGDGYIAYLELQGESVVTSGSYQRYYTVDGERYHHIIDPETLMPAKGFLSVSVVCKDSGMADALSTALFCMSLEEGKTLIESLPDTEAMWVGENGEQSFSSGWSKYTK